MSNLYELVECYYNSYAQEVYFSVLIRICDEGYYYWFCCVS